MTKRKSYNPFKMWGSYLGGLLLVVWTIYLNRCLSSISGICQDDVAIQYLLSFSGLSNLGVSFFSGFLIGWGIHSFFRRLLK